MQISDRYRDEVYRMERVEFLLYWQLVWNRGVKTRKSQGCSSVCGPGFKIGGKNATSAVPPSLLDGRSEDTGTLLSGSPGTGTSQRTEFFPMKTAAQTGDFSGVLECLRTPGRDNSWLPV